MERRKKEHLREIAVGNKLPKYNKARSLIKKGFKLKMRTIKTTPDEAKAYEIERMYIKKYRKDGYILMNCTSGGPDEKLIRINKPKKENQNGIKLPLIKTSKKRKRKK